MPTQDPHTLLECRACPRLATFLDGVREQHPDYHARPVEAFGDASPQLLIVGLAPGLHGANRTGRPFTGDGCSDFLYGTLHRWGWSSAPTSVSADDGLRLHGARITNAVKCLPPQNLPTPEEVRTCRSHLMGEISTLRPRAILSLGAVAHRAVLAALGLAPKGFAFAHGGAWALHGDEAQRPRPATRPQWLLSSYHPSRYNLNTGRVTQASFDAVFERLARCLEGGAGQ